MKKSHAVPTHYPIVMQHFSCRVFSYARTTLTLNLTLTLDNLKM